MTRSLDKILEDLGGEAPVAEKLGCGQSAISNWKARGVPKGRWVDLVMLGAQQGVEPAITLDEVRAASVAITEAAETKAAQATEAA